MRGWILMENWTAAKIDISLNSEIENFNRKQSEQGLSKYWETFSVRLSGKRLYPMSINRINTYFKCILFLCADSD